MSGNVSKRWMGDLIRAFLIPRIALRSWEDIETNWSDPSISKIKKAIDNKELNLLSGVLNIKTKDGVFNYEIKSDSKVLFQESSINEISFFDFEPLILVKYFLSK